MPIIIWILTFIIIGALPFHKCLVLWIHLSVAPLLQLFYCQRWAHPFIYQNLKQLNFMQTATEIMASQSPLLRTQLHTRMLPLIVMIHTVLKYVHTGFNMTISAILHLFYYCPTNGIGPQVYSKNFSHIRFLFRFILIPKFIEYFLDITIILQKFVAIRLFLHLITIRLYAEGYTSYASAYPTWRLFSPIYRHRKGYPHRHPILLLFLSNLAFPMKRIFCVCL